MKNSETINKRKSGLAAWAGVMIAFAIGIMCLNGLDGRKGTEQAGAYLSDFSPAGNYALHDNRASFFAGEWTFPFNFDAYVRNSAFPDAFTVGLPLTAVSPAKKQNSNALGYNPDGMPIPLQCALLTFDTEWIYPSYLPLDYDGFKFSFYFYFYSLVPVYDVSVSSGGSAAGSAFLSDVTYWTVSFADIGFAYCHFVRVIGLTSGINKLSVNIMYNNTPGSSKPDFNGTVYSYYNSYNLANHAPPYLVEYNTFDSYFNGISKSIKNSSHWSLNFGSDYPSPIEAPPHYNFSGWYRDAGLTVPYDGSVLPEGTPLYPKFVLRTYQINFDTGFAGLSMEPKAVQALSAGGPVISPEKTGYAFQGWYTDTGKKSEYDSGISMTGDMTLYADWAIRYYTVTFMSAGAVVKELEVPYGMSLTQALKEAGLQLYSVTGVVFESGAVENVTGDFGIADNAIVLVDSMSPGQKLQTVVTNYWYILLGGFGIIALTACLIPAVSKKRGKKKA